MSLELAKLMIAFALGLSVLMIVAIYLRSSRSGSAARYLIIYLTITAVLLIDAMLMLIGGSANSYRPNTLLSITIWLIGPSIYLYTRALLGQATTSIWWYALWTLGGMAVLFAGATWGYTSPLYRALVVGYYLQVTAYLYAAVSMIRRREKSMSPQARNMRAHSLLWLRSMMIGFSIVWCADFAAAIWAFAGGPSSLMFYLAFLWVESAWLIVMALFAMVYPDTVVSRVRDNRSDRYQNSGLSAEAADQLMHTLNMVMTRDQPHLDSELSLGGLAERVGVRPQLLSQLLNECAGCGFYEFVNRARVKAAEGLLADPAMARVPLRQIAEFAGFNNKKTFNDSFKRVHATTPGAFRKLCAARLGASAES